MQPAGQMAENLDPNVNFEVRKWSCQVEFKLLPFRVHLQ